MQALQSAEQAIEGIKAQLDQANLYIQQQDSKIFALEEDSQVQLLMKRIDSETKIYIEQMKQAGSDQRAQAEIEASRQESMAKWAVDMAKIKASQPQVNVIEGVRPDYNAVGGMRNSF
jgi:multidrug resistance efflux pump